MLIHIPYYYCQLNTISRIILVQITVNVVKNVVLFVLCSWVGRRAGPRWSSVCAFSEVVRPNLDAARRRDPQDFPPRRGKTNGVAGKPTPKTASRVGGGLRDPKTGAVLGSATGRPEDSMARCKPSKRADSDYEDKPPAKVSIPNWTPVEDVVRARPGGPYRAAVCPGGSRLLGLDRAGPV